MVFEILLKRLVKSGSVVFIDMRGQKTAFGDGQEPKCTLRSTSRTFERRIPYNPALYFSEAYLDGDLVFDEGGIEDFLTIALQNYEALENHWLVKLGYLLVRQTRWVKQHNPIGKAQKNVAHHYDLSSTLYDLFLDPDRQYSCAYFNDPSESLDSAQESKKRHIAAKLRLDEPELKLLDIGSGWGGLGLYLAKAGNCDVTGVTLSVEQHKLSQERAKREELDQRVRFRLQDYREEAKTYDRIVSVGMFEHVGKKNYKEFFNKVYELLDDDGVCLLHTIGRFNEPGPINPFIRKYIFPGADVPTLSEVTPSIEEAGFFITDIEILRLHYAETLRYWYDRFQANRDKVEALYDERFCRMWELYLKSCELGFRYQGLTVFQIQLTKKQEALPLTRDYIYEWEHAQSSEQSQAAEYQAAE